MKKSLPLHINPLKPQCSLQNFNTLKLPLRIASYFMLSWIYALCSQIIIPLSFAPVPVSLQPLPLLLAAALLGNHAVYAYGLYLLQGALGAPFFSCAQAGILHLFGPTGGYLFGFGLAMIVITHQNFAKNKSVTSILLRLIPISGIYFACGVGQLALLVGLQTAISYGFYPFILGDLAKLCFAAILIVQSHRISTPSKHA